MVLWLTGNLAKRLPGMQEETQSFTGDEDGINIFII
jgi:hypothetical protein